MNVDRMLISLLKLYITRIMHFLLAWMDILKSRVSYLLWLVCYLYCPLYLSQMQAIILFVTEHLRVLSLRPSLSRMLGQWQYKLLVVCLRVFPLIFHKRMRM